LGKATLFAESRTSLKASRADDPRIGIQLSDHGGWRVVGPDLHGMFPLDHKGRFIRLDDAPNNELEVH